MIDPSLYNTSVYKLDVALVNKRQIQFIPVLWIYGISEAAAIYDYPMPPEEIGRLAYYFFERIQARNLPCHDPFKKYWLVPKGIRSYKKYVEATFMISLVWDGDILKVVRWYPAKGRGFDGGPSGDRDYNASFPAYASNEELGTFILQQFAFIEKRRRELGLLPESK